MCCPNDDLPVPSCPFIRESAAHGPLYKSRLWYLVPTVNDSPTHLPTGDGLLFTEESVKAPAAGVVCSFSGVAGNQCSSHGYGLKERIKLLFSYTYSALFI